MRLMAACVVCEEQDGNYLLGFADSATDTSKYVMLQRSVELSEQDRNLGFDQPHIEIDDQSRSQYGGITRAELSDGRLLLLLDDNAKKTLKEESVEVLYETTQHPSRMIADQLLHILGPEKVSVDLR